MITADGYSAAVDSKTCGDGEETTEGGDRRSDCVVYGSLLMGESTSFQQDAISKMLFLFPLAPDRDISVCEAVTKGRVVAEAGPGICSCSSFRILADAG